jgi:hypothetical protein
MRICEKHLARASDTLVSKKTGAEYDICEICEKELEQILHEQVKQGELDGRKRVVGRPKTNKG